MSTKKFQTDLAEWQGPYGLKTRATHPRFHTHLCSSSSESDKDPAHGMTTLRTQLQIVSETMHSDPLLAKDKSALLGSLAERHPPPGILPPGS
ncbi:unnamed protein product [Prunus armeniaca]